MTPRLYPLFALLLCVSFQLFAQTPEFQWGKSGVGFWYNRGQSIAVDDDANVYVSGYFQSSVSFGSSTMNAVGFRDIFLAKYDKNGVLLWVDQYGVTGANNGIDLIVGEDNHLYLVGEHTGATIFGSDTLGAGTLNGNVRAFVAKFDLNGTPVWAKEIEDAYTSSFRSIVYEPGGHLYLTGSYQDTTIIANDTLISSSYCCGSGLTLDVFTVKMDTAGNFVWGKTGGGSSVDRGGKVSLDTLGHVYVAGTYTNNGCWDGNCVTGSNSARHYFVVKYDTSGNVIWVFRPGITNNDPHHTAIADKAGNIFVPHYNTGSAFLRKYDTNHQLLWSRSMSNAYAKNQQSIILDKHGDVYLSGLQIGPTTFGTHQPNSVGASLFVAKCSSAGVWEWAVSGGYIAGITEGISLDLDTVGNVYVTGHFRGSPSFGPVSLNGTNYEDIFVLKVNTNPNFITGTTYQDLNANQVQNTNEGNYPNVMVEVQPGPLFFYSDSSGDYTAVTDTGIYSVSIPNPPLYYSVGPGSHIANFNAYGQIDSLNHFGLVPTPNINDLRVDLAPSINFRPGFNSGYWLTYSNVGTNTLSGTVTLVYDDSLTYTTSSVTPTSVSGTTLTWNFSNLAPTESESIWIGFTVPVTLPLGHVLNSVATVNPITGDNIPSDNIDSLVHITSGSYDPNDKLVSPSGILRPAQVASTFPLEYTVRFQNTGTDTAFTVIIQDQLSSNLDLSTFEMIGASHPYSVSTDGQGKMEWRFDQILLPDSTTNQLGSRGFVKFRIAPLTTLVVGDSIPNHAAIYFDFNAPIYTNTAITRIESLVLTATATAPTSCFNLQDGTASGSVNVTDPSLSYSIDGLNFQSSPDFAGLAPGTYTLWATDVYGDTVVSNSFMITAPPAISVSGVVTQHPVCFGDSTGEIQLTASGGTGSLSYSSDSLSFLPFPLLSDLPAGTWYAWVQDANGCVEKSAAMTVIDPPAIAVSAVATDEIIGTMNGTIEVTASGGTGSLNYSLDGTTFQSSNLFTGLATGSYTVTVEDSMGCSQTFDIDVLSSTGIQDQVEEPYTFHPNPFVDQFTVTLGGAALSGAWEVLDLEGRSIFAGTFDQQKRLTLERGELPAGIYFMRIEIANGRSSIHKVVAR